MLKLILRTHRGFFADDVIANHIVPIAGGDQFVSIYGRANDIDLSAKRVLDILLSCIALVLLLPIFAVVSIAIKIQDPGPAIFRQKRWGKDCRIFTVYKFRTMYLPVCDVTGANQTTQNDGRITSIGRFLRRSNIDELPQLINVILGDMSLVGPRCHPVKMYAGGMDYEKLVPNYHRRHAVKPGLTGLAQINQLRGPTTNPEKAKKRIAHDRLYVIKSDVWLDMKIIVVTIAQELRGGVGF